MSACQLIVSCEPSCIVVAASAGLLELTGHTEAELLLKPASLFRGDATCASTAAALRTAIQVSRHLALSSLIPTGFGALAVTRSLVTGVPDASAPLRASDTIPLFWPREARVPWRRVALQTRAGPPMFEL
jgi:hypothetical protein